MPLDTRKSIMTALLLTPAFAWASTVHHCTDENGHVTFTTLGCPTGQAMQLQQAHNAPPGTAAPSSTSTPKKTVPTQRSEPVVVGQRDDGCGNVLSAEQRRRAILDYQTPAGMTKRDVENLLGRPDKVTSRNGEVRYVYEEKNGRSRQVSFDEHGCVKGNRENVKR
jgi:outer membrane protein assembly factor BamE (lipoprotein component of BamABCDE complex)